MHIITAEMVDNHVIVSEDGHVVDRIVVQLLPSGFVEMSKSDLLIQLPESSVKCGDEPPYLFHVFTTADKMVKVCNAKDFESAYLSVKERWQDVQFLHVMIEFSTE